MYTTKSLHKAMLLKLNCTDYKLAQTMKITRSAVSAWTCKSIIMSDEVGLKAAKILGLDKDRVLISLAAERAKDSPIAKEWQRIYNTLAA